jgi:hypothetical protein
MSVRVRVRVRVRMNESEDEGEAISRRKYVLPPKEPSQTAHVVAIPYTMARAPSLVLAQATAMCAPMKSPQDVTRC